MRLILAISVVLFSNGAFSYSEPSCEELNDLMKNKYSKEIYFAWEKLPFPKEKFIKQIGVSPYIDEAFPCPSLAASSDTLKESKYSYYHAAKQLNMLDKINVLDSQGNEIFDYYSYVVEGLDTMGLRSDDLDVFEAVGEDSFGDIYLPNRFFQESTFHGTAALVHERRHFDNDKAARKHVVCDGGKWKGLEPPSCDEYNPDWKKAALTITILCIL